MKFSRITKSLFATFGLCISFPVLAAAQTEITSQPMVGALASSDVVPIIRTANGVPTVYQAPASLFMGQTGATGQAATIQVGTITNLACGATPTITNRGTTLAAVLDFGIPNCSSGGGSGGTDANAWHVTDDLAAAYVTPTNGVKTNLGTILAQLQSAASTVGITQAQADLRYLKLNADISNMTVIVDGVSTTVAKAISAASSGGGGTSSSNTDPNAWHTTDDLASAYVTPTGGARTTIGAEFAALISQVSGNTGISQTAADARYWLQGADLAAATVTPTGGAKTTIGAEFAALLSQISSIVPGISQTSADGRYWLLNADMSSGSVTPTGGTKTTFGAALASLSTQINAIVPGITQTAADGRYWAQSSDIGGATVAYSGGSGTLKTALNTLAAAPGIRVAKAMTVSGAVSLPVPASGDIVYLLTSSANATLQFSGKAAAGQAQIVTLRIIGSSNKVTLPTTNVSSDNASMPTVATTVSGAVTEVSYRFVDGSTVITGGI